MRVFWASLCLPWAAWAITTSQTINLEQGWNSVWLTLQPDDGAVEAVFADSAIQMVMTPQVDLGAAEFVGDVGRVRVNQDGWRSWRRSSPVQEHTLALVRAHRGYLIYADSAITLTVTGEAWFERPEFRPDGYSLIGFSLSEAKTFDDVPWLEPSRILRLQADGNWVGVGGADSIGHNEAYWIRTEGAFQWDMALRFPGTRWIDLGEGPSDLVVSEMDLQRFELSLRNAADSAIAVGITKVFPDEVDDTTDRLRLFEVVPDPDTASFAIGQAGQVTTWDVGDIAAGETRTLTIGAERNWDSDVRTQENLYRLEIGGMYFWLPIKATNDLATGSSLSAGDAAYAGLWAGEVVLDSVTSLTETGKPVKPATTKAPMQVLLHAESAGTVSLLSHVMVMQRKDLQVDIERPQDAEQVLVVDESKISFFEGIEERGGKKVARRLESVAYDMPRKLDLSTQAALLAEIAALLDKAENEVTAQELTDYVNSRSSRPPALVEAYHLTWPLQGGLAPNAEIGTAVGGELALDPFHRSNPYRHAFHPKHGAGYALTRSLTMRFEDATDAGVLVGEYEETISGLIATDLVMKGRIRLQRLSDVGNCNEKAPSFPSPSFCAAGLLGSGHRRQ